MEATIEQLREVTLFHDLDDETLDKVLMNGHVVEWAAGQTIIKEEDRKGEVFHLILDGMAEVSVRGKPVSSAGPGDYFGELSLLDGKPRAASVTAATDITTFSLASWHFSRLLHDQPPLLEAVLGSLCDRIRALTEAVSS